MFERFPEVERVVLGPFKRKKWMRFRDGHVRIRNELELGFVVVGYCHEGRQDAIIRCAQQNRPVVRDLIEALSCGEISLSNTQTDKSREIGWESRAEMSIYPSKL